MGYWSLSPEAGSRHKMCPSVNCNKEWYTVCSVITVHITISLYCWIYKKSQLLVVFIPNWNHPSYKIKKNNNNNLLPLSVPLLLCSNTAVFFDYAHIFFIPTALHIITVAFQFRLCAGMSESPPGEVFIVISPKTHQRHWQRACECSCPVFVLWCIHPVK